MNIITVDVNDLTPYENNPRKNKDAVQYVKNSIEQFGFKVPIVVDKDGVIVAGHTRVLAAKELGMKQVPAVVADDLTEEQVRAFRLADNSTAEMSSWDFDKLEVEILKIGTLDVGDFGLNGLDYNEIDIDKYFTDKENAVEDAPKKKQIVCPNCGEIIEI